MSKKSRFKQLLAEKRLPGLRSKIIVWFFVPTAIILMAVALVTLISYQQVTEDLVLERDQDLVRLSAGQLATELSPHTELLTTLSRQLDTYIYYPPALRLTLVRAEDDLAGFDQGVVVLNHLGEVIATDPEQAHLIGQDWSGQSYFQAVIASQKPVFSDIFETGPQNKAVIALAVPITGNQGELFGAVVGLFGLAGAGENGFYESIHRLDLDQGSPAYLIDSAGRMLYHSEYGRIGEDFSDWPALEPVLNHQAGAIRIQDGADQNMVVGFAPVPGTPWKLVIEESWEVLTRGSRWYRQFLLLLLVMGVFIPTLVVAIGLQRIMQPIEDLQQAAQEVARGNFGQTITAQTGDEIEDLAEHFNRMSAQLQESYTNLEQRVADRTRELAILNAIGVMVNESLDLPTTLDRILDETLGLLNLEVGEVCLVEEATDELIIRSERGLSLDFLQQSNRRPISEVLPQHCIISGEPVIEEDVFANPERQVARDEGLRALAIFPLRAKERLLGSLCLATRQGPRRFSRSERELLRAISDQAAVAVENAGLYAQTNRRIDEIETLFAVQQAITSDLNPDAVLQLIADEARRLTSSEGAILFLVNGDCLELSVLSSEVASGVSVGYRLPLTDSLTELTFSSSQPIRVDDARNDQRTHKDLIHRLAIRTLMVVPLMSGSDPLGSISVFNRTSGSFNVDDERVMAMLASSAVIGIENARLYQQEQARRHEADQRRRVAEGLRDVLTVLNSNRPLEQILDYIAVQAGRLLVTDTVAIYRLHAEEKLLRIQAARGLPADYVTNMTIPVGEGVVGRAILEGQPVSVPEIRLNAVPEYLSSDSPRQIYLSYLGENFRALLAVPMTVRDEVYGGIVLYYPEPREFHAEEIDLAVSFANQTALAIENARLFAQAEQAAILEERQRLARDLHDSVTQSLYGVTMFAEAAARLLESGRAEVAGQHLREVRETAQEALQEMRLLLFELRPPILEEEGLAVALQARLEAVEGRSGLQIEFEADGVDRLPVEVEEGLYRIAQEALNNILKHAQAQSVTAHLAYEQNRVILEIIDDGVGIDPNASQRKGGLGLKGMMERAAAMGGSLTIQNQPGRGTVVRVEVELPPETPT
jgi:signal transduction histidine kinase